MSKHEIENKSKTKIVIILILIMIIGVIGFFIINNIVNVKHNYAITRLIINQNDVTEYLKSNVYIDESGEIYLSKEDIRKFL